MKKFIILLLLLFIPLQPVYASIEIPILVYHSIDEYKGMGSKELFVTPTNFQKQMEYLKQQGYTLLTFENWEEKGKVAKPIFITIDDGYKNVWNAFEIFQKLKDDQFHPKATLFIISDYIGNPNRLTNEDLKQLSDSSYFSIQSHTALHPDLTKNIDYKSELLGSKEKIERIVGKPVISLSYPYGNFNSQVVKETKKYYQYGLTTTPGRFQEKGYKDELYLLPRSYVKYSTTLEEFLKLIGEK